MVSWLHRLTEIEPPPRDPVGAGSAEMWLGAEAKCGFQFPSDYRHYVLLYGAGRWNGFFGVFSPCYRGEHAVEWFRWMKTALDGLDDFHRSFPTHAPPFLRYPAPNGLIPIGYTDNGGTICWETRGEPDSWNIVCLADKYSLGYDKSEASLTGFLVGLLERRFALKTFPADFYPISKPAFVPYPE